MPTCIRQDRLDGDSSLGEAFGYPDQDHGAGQASVVIVNLAVDLA